MHKVTITTIVKSIKALEAGFEKWAKSVGAVESEDSLSAIVPGRKILLSKIQSTGGIRIEFDGGYLSDTGFTYEFDKDISDTKMVFKGYETDYGYGDIRQILSGCEVSEVVEITNLVLATKVWSK